MGFLSGGRTAQGMRGTASHPTVAVAHRIFRDRHGAVWQVWDVVPGAVRGSTRLHPDRRASPDPAGPYTGPERRNRTDRRIQARVTPGLEGGWLTFESATEQRRVVPIPARWDTLADGESEELCRHARLVPKIKLI